MSGITHRVGGDGIEGEARNADVFSQRQRLDRAAIARDKRSAEILLERARVEAFSVVDPFLVAVAEDDGGTIEPLSLREKIRASGLTFDAIAADAVRYA
ncbi:MAG: DUF2849 domain-containing protein [Reyranella sp.]